MKVFCFSNYNWVIFLLCSVVMLANEEGNGCKEKIVTATKKGAAVLDQWLPDDIKAHYHVLQLASLY